MAEQGYTPTDADQQRAREALAGLLVEYSDTDGPVTSYTTGPADGDEDAVLNLAERFAEVRADERAKQPDLPCDRGCNVNDGPMEDCSQHGRSPRDLWGIIDAYGSLVTGTQERAIRVVRGMKAALEAEGGEKP